MTASESERSPLCLSPTACGTMHSSLRCRTYSKLFLLAFNPDCPCAPLGLLTPLSSCFLRVRASWTFVQPVSGPSIPIRYLHTFIPIFCPLASELVSVLFLLPDRAPVSIPSYTLWFLRWLQLPMILLSSVTVFAIRFNNSS